MIFIPHYDGQEERHLLGTRFGTRSDQTMESNMPSQNSHDPIQNPRGRMYGWYQQFVRNLRFNVSNPRRNPNWKSQSTKRRNRMDKYRNTDFTSDKENFQCMNHIILTCKNDEDKYDRNKTNDDMSDISMTSKMEMRSHMSLWLSYWKNRMKSQIRASLKRSRDGKLWTEAHRMSLPKYRPYLDQDESYQPCFSQNDSWMLSLSLHAPTLNSPTESSDDCCNTTKGTFSLEDDFPLLLSSSLDRERTLDMRTKKILESIPTESSRKLTATSTTTQNIVPHDEDIGHFCTNFLPLFPPPENLQTHPTTTFTKIIIDKSERAQTSISLQNPFFRDKEDDGSLILYSHHPPRVKLPTATTSRTATSTQMNDLQMKHHPLPYENLDPEDIVEIISLINYDAYPSIHLSAEESIVSDLTNTTDDVYENRNDEKNFTSPNLLRLDKYPYDETWIHEEGDIYDI
jgi:hypothetical protein